MSKNPITKEGYELLKKKLHKLKNNDHPEIIKELEHAFSFGDFRENAEYDAAKEKAGVLESKIHEIESFIQNAEIIDINKLNEEKIAFGASVLLLDLDSDEKKFFKIVGEYETKPEKGLISYKSPLARKMLGKRNGEEFVFKSPKEKKYYKVSQVEYK